MSWQPYSWSEVADDEEFAAVKPLDGDRIVALAGNALELEKVCESPIEIMLGAEVKAELDAVGSGLELVPQFKWQRFRMDFALLRHGNPVCFIECDGAEFHSTPEQIANDRKKDQAAASADIPLIRFSGSEIFRSAEQIARMMVGGRR